MVTILSSSVLISLWPRRGGVLPEPVDRHQDHAIGLSNVAPEAAGFFRRETDNVQIRLWNFPKAFPCPGRGERVFTMTGA